MDRLSVQILLAALALPAALLIGGCSAAEVERDDLATVVDRDAIIFTPEAFSEEAVDLMASNKVIVVGETHWIFEHRELIANMVAELHPKGLRQVLLEFPQAAEWLIDDYMQGGVLEPDWVPPLGLNGDLIEAIREFNQTVPESEWVRVRGIDVMLDEYGGSDDFRWLMDRISHHLGDPVELTDFMSGHHGSMNQRMAALQNLAGHLETRQSQLRDVWGDYWYDTISEVVEVEQSSETVREWRADRYDDSAELREDLMKDLADRRLRGYGHKTLINVGGNHAQKSFMLGTNQEWLGDYLVHKSSALGGSIIAVNVRPAQILSEDESREIWNVADSSPPNELWRVMSETAPNRVVLLPLDDRMFSEETVLMNYEGEIYEASPKDVYDVLISLPVAHQVPQ